MYNMRAYVHMHIHWQMQNMTDSNIDSHALWHFFFVDFGRTVPIEFRSRHWSTMRVRALAQGVCYFAIQQDRENRPRTRDIASCST